MSRPFTELNRLPLRFWLGEVACELLYWGYFGGEAWWRNYRHVHSFFEVCYAFRGRGTFRLGDNTYEIVSGDLFVARPNEAHDIVADKADPLGIYFWAYTLVPPAKGSRHDVDALLHAFAEGDGVLAHQAEAVAATLELLEHEVANAAPGYAQAAEALTLKLILETARAVATVETEQGEDAAIGDVTVATILRYLRDNYDRPLSLKEVAAQVNLSERHTSRLFKSETGTSVKQYVLELRLEVAKQLLLSGGVSVAEVAYRAGYSDVRHFSTLFRQRTGMTPTDYRSQGGTRFL